MELTPAIRSTTFSIIHFFCIGMMVLLIIKTLQRYNLKKKASIKTGGSSGERTRIIKLLLEFELIVLFGFILQNLSSDALLYTRLQQEQDPAYQNLLLLTFVEYTNFFFEFVLIFVGYFLALFSNRIFLFLGRKFDLLNTIFVLVVASILMLGLILAGIDPALNFVWDVYSALTGKRNPEMWIMVVCAMYIILILILTLWHSLKAYRKASNPVERGGIAFINLFFIFIILLMVFQGIFIVTKIYFFSFSSWLLIPIGILWAYFGLIMPKKLRSWLENK
ncbi:MAG: hypothetical protein ACTSWN_03405 [Promethearchaeota archaeon]